MLALAPKARPDTKAFRARCGKLALSHGPKKALVLYEELGISTTEELADAIHEVALVPHLAVRDVSHDDDAPPRRRVDAAECRRPLAQAGRQLDVLVGDPDRHGHPFPAKLEQVPILLDCAGE